MTVTWTPDLHPRDRLGRFRDSLDVDLPRAGGRAIEGRLNKRYEDWALGLSDREHDGLNWYQAAGYADINRKLRKGGEMGDRQQAYLEGMDSAIAKAPGLEQPSFFYRGINDVTTFLGTNDPQMLVGTEFVDRGFSSMSTRDLVAWHARGSGKAKGAALAKIEAPAGLRGAWVPSLYDKWAPGYKRGAGVPRPKNALAQDEQEFIPPRGTIFRITKATRSKKGGLDLTMEIVGVEDPTDRGYEEHDAESTKFVWEAGDVVIRARAYEWNPRLHPRDPKGRWAKTGSSFIAPWKNISLAKSEFPESEVTMTNLSPEEATRVRTTWERQTGHSADSVAQNIRDVFRSAEGTEAWEGGKTWYRDAHDWADERAKTHGLTTDTVAAVLAALSPMTEWGENKKQADLMLQYRSRDPEHFDSLPPQEAFHEAREWAVARGEKWQLGAGRRSGISAAQLLQGATPGEILPQAKTRGFYNSIAVPDNPYDVVIDSHMLNVAYGGLTEGPGGLLIEVPKPGSADVWGDVVTPEGAGFTARAPFSWFGSPKVRGRDVGVIPLLADAVRAAADEWNQDHPDEPLSPMQVQAITWVRWLQLHPAQEKRGAVKAAQRATLAAARLAAEGVTA